LRPPPLLLTEVTQQAIHGFSGIGLSTPISALRLGSQPTKSWTKS
jgi:hypothetical protein